MTIPNAKLDEIERGCEGVTPGPWEVYDGCSWRRIGTAPAIGRDYDDCAVLYPNVASDGHPDMNAGRGQNTYANLNHIARLDPQTVLALIADLRETRKALDEVNAAITGYVDALVARQHGGIAQNRAFDAICSALERNTTREMDSRRAALPKET